MADIQGKVRLLRQLVVPASLRGRSKWPLSIHRLFHNEKKKIRRYKSENNYDADCIPATAMIRFAGLWRAQMNFPLSGTFPRKLIKRKLRT